MESAIRLTADMYRFREFARRVRSNYRHEMKEVAAIIRAKAESSGLSETKTWGQMVKQASDDNADDAVLLLTAAIVEMCEGNA